MSTEERLLFEAIETFGGPRTNRGHVLDFYPSDDFLLNLTKRYNLEFASVFTMGLNRHYLWTGTRDSIQIPLGGQNQYEILIKHTHPGGSPFPSIYDINWLVNSQKNGSPQKKSIILPIGAPRFSFNIYSQTN